jgi:hypothetical protein
MPTGVRRETGDESAWRHKITGVIGFCFLAAATLSGNTTAECAE